MKSFDTNKTDNGEGKPLCISTYFFYIDDISEDKIKNTISYIN
jgi:hypothetical protein